MRPYLLTLITLLLPLGCACDQSPTRSSNPAYAESTPIRLFDGKSLNGFKTWLGGTKYKDPKKIFTVRNGILRISGDGFGYLATRNAYQNYRLLVEFKWGSKNFQHRIGKARDSGIFLHSIGLDGNSFDGNGAFKSAIECQIMEGSVGDFILIRGNDAEGKPIPIRLTTTTLPNPDSEGWFTYTTATESARTRTLHQKGRINWHGKSKNWTDTFGYRARNDIESPPNQWTTVECICIHDRITIKVNGSIVNHAYNAFPTSGPILLQCEGSEIFIRRMDLYPITPPSVSDAD